MICTARRRRRTRNWLRHVAAQYFREVVCTLLKIKRSITALSGTPDNKHRTSNETS